MSRILSGNLPRISRVRGLIVRSAVVAVAATTLGVLNVSPANAAPPPGATNIGSAIKIGGILSKNTYISRTTVDYTGVPGTAYLIMQADGNLVQYYNYINGQRVCWASNTNVSPAPSAVWAVYNSANGSLEVWQNYHRVWGTNTTDTRSGLTVDMGLSGNLYVGYTTVGPRCMFEYGDT